jgi:predicted dienelactone hydrolase
MRHVLAAVSFAALLAFAPTIATAGTTEAGIMQLRIPAAHRAGPLDTYIWYPADGGGSAIAVGENPLFVGVTALRDAEIAAGTHPLILLSHGSGGNAANLAWLATALAKAGFIVAAVNHPGTTSGDSRPSETLKLWQRPADLSALIDALLQNPDLAPHIDAGRIGVSGFSLGGHSTLSLAGARVDEKAFARYCDENRETISDCAWYRKGKVDLHALDPKIFDRANADPRIKAAAAFDPAIAPAYRRESLEALSMPVLIVNFGGLGQIPMGVDSAEMVKRVPGAVYRTIADAHHFSFLGICRPDGKEFLKAEGEEDPICDDRGGRPREEIHAEIAERAIAFFREALK